MSNFSFYGWHHIIVLTVLALVALLINSINISAMTDPVLNLLTLQPEILQIAKIIVHN